MGEGWQGARTKKESFPWQDFTHYYFGFRINACEEAAKAMKKFKRSDFDFLLGKEDYEPGLIDAFAFALMFALFAIAFDHPGW